MTEEELRREAQEEEKFGRECENKGDFVFAKISFENAKQLWEQAGDIGRAENLQDDIERVEELWEMRKELE